MDMSGDAVLACPACGAALLPDDQYCEHCGSQVGVANDGTPQTATRAGQPAGAPGEQSTHVSAPPPVEHRDDGNCRTCGAPADAIDADRYCSHCGVRQRAPEDRQKIDLLLAAGVSDRGRTHRRNEDALYLETVGETGVVAVVCDGVSSSASSDIAARNAADAAGQVLADALRAATGALTDATTAHAICTAQQAVLAVPWTPHRNLDMPSCTFLSAACRNGELVIGWLGDSRAYWIAGQSSRQLTVDDSWAQEQIDAGSLNEQEAGADPRAHEITRWLGPDAVDDPPHLLTTRPSEPGRLVLCSDGLWNYASGVADIAALIDTLPANATPLTVAQSLTDTALAAGGHDNITVVVVNVQPQKGDRK
jgi:serine/threonine protein phosphatase PrpC